MRGKEGLNDGPQSHCRLDPLHECLAFPASPAPWPCWVRAWLGDGAVPRPHGGEKTAHAQAEQHEGPVQAERRTLQRAWAEMQAAVLPARPAYDRGELDGGG